MTTITAKVDSKGRLLLGKKFASCLVIVREISDGLLQVVKAEAVPAREAWLYKNPEALAMVMEGIRQASQGELTDGPNMAEGAKLVKMIERESRQ